MGDVLVISLPSHPPLPSSIVHPIHHVLLAVCKQKTATGAWRAECAISLVSISGTLQLTIPSAGRHVQRLIIMILYLQYRRPLSSSIMIPTTPAPRSASSTSRIM